MSHMANILLLLPLTTNPQRRLFLFFSRREIPLHSLPADGNDCVQAARIQRMRVLCLLGLSLPCDLAQSSILLA